MIIYSELAIFVLFSLLIAAINVINFTAVGDDADHITERIATSDGFLKKGKSDKRPENHAPKMGPNSPEMEESMRYFTFAFDKKGNSKKVEYKLSSVTEQEAEEWARSLVNEKKGWTRVTYRYRSYKEGEWKYVTVIDQSRELSPSYRVLFVSIGGELAALLICLLILISVSRRLFAPLEEANRKQEKFIANIENDFKLPLTVINANTEIIEKENGASTEYTNSINRQVRKMTQLLKRLSALTIYEDRHHSETRINFSDLLKVVLDGYTNNFEEKGIVLESRIMPDVMLNGDEDALRKACRELVENSLNYAVSYTVFLLEQHAERIVLIQKNNANLPNGMVNQVFDRFTTLENGAQAGGTGLGLSYVKDIVRNHGGRVRAMVEDHEFVLTIDL